jgi:predicted esterase
MTQRTQRRSGSAAAQGSLRSRPLAVGQVQARGAGYGQQVGIVPLNLERGRDGFLYIPRSYQPGQPAPLVVMLHGSGGIAYSILTPFTALAEANGIILLAPDARQETWDLIMSEYGEDVAFTDRALELTFRRYTIDGTHIALGGFSDGASYALSLGLANGDLFNHIIAFSPGFMAPPRLQGHPRVFISHGTHDQVLPVRASRHIVEELRQAGYEVTYQEFNGPHTVPPEIARAGFAWFMETPATIA